MSARGRITVEVIIALVVACVTVGGIVFAAGGLATKAYTDQAVEQATAPLARKEAIEPQLTILMSAVQELRGDVKELLKRPAGGKP